MTKTYEPADDSVRAMLDRVVDEHHPLLREAHAFIAVLMVTAPTDDEGVPKSPALSVGGWPAQARIKITSLRERALGMADAVMEIDSYAWGQRSEDEQEALLDHELTHIQAHLDGEGEEKSIRSDERGRPVLTMRQHDVRFEGFFDVMKRHGQAAPEHALFEGVIEGARQYELALPGVASADAPPETKRRPRTRDALKEG